ncbi:MAG: hypothetical protein JNJ54_18895 [Myxococcaceae bacterium]|nr:hypothetical protein [Myxococcaceae bacterium]
MRVSLIAVALLLAACQKAPANTPEGAFRAFNDALRRQDAKTAFSLLSEKSQALLTERSKALASGSKGAIRDEPALLTFLTPRRANPLVSISVASASEASALIEVKTCARPLDAAGTCPAGADVQERVAMVKEVQRWAVELPELVKP